MHFGHTRQRIVHHVESFCPGNASILELSCGDGKLLKHFEEKGHVVTGTNYSRYDNVEQGLDIVNGVDITRRLPFDDDSFDCLILSETIQNIPDHVSVLKEIRRVLKIGGVFILTTPNMQSIKSRIHFLLTGFFKVKWKFIGFDTPLDKAFGFHNHPVHLPVMMYYLSALDMKAEDIDGIYIKPKSYLFYVLLAPLILVATYLKTRFGEKYLKRSGASQAVFRGLTRRNLLLADRLSIVARKEEERTHTAEGTRLPSWSGTFDREDA